MSNCYVKYCIVQNFLLDRAIFLSFARGTEFCRPGPGGDEISFDAIVFATGYKSTANMWLKVLTLNF